MSFWTKIRGPLATIGAAVAGYFTGGASYAALGAMAGSTAWQNDIAKQQAARANKQAQANQIAAEQRQVKYTQMQNLYNSPVNQMRRLYEAGLNPMLVYGGGNVTGNMSGTYANSSAPQSYVADKKLPDFYRLAGMMDTGLNLQYKEAQIAGIKQQQDAFSKNLQVQLEHAKLNNKALRLQNAILEHDLNVILPGKNTISRDNSWLARGDRAFGSVKNYLNFDKPKSKMDESKNPYVHSNFLKFINVLK